METRFSHVASMLTSMVALSLLASCAQKASEQAKAPEPTPQSAGHDAATPPGDVAPSTSPAVRGPSHWIQDQQLRAVMQRIGRGGPTTWPDKHLPSDPEEPVKPEVMASAFREAETLADSLAAASLQIPTMISGRTMPEADRRGIQDLTSTLWRASTELKDATKAHNVERMQRSLETINRTCLECHTRYRDLTGVLDPGRADAGALRRPGEARVSIAHGAGAR